MEDKVAVSHYFIEDPNLAHQVEAFSYYFGDRRFRFESDAGVFSPGHVDPATDLLLHQLPALSGEVLDLGCGWGPVGTVLGALYPETARITMSDVNGRALALAERNSRANGVEAACVLSDGFEGLEGPFDAVVLNPPIHAGKSVIFGFYEGAFSHLREKGRLFVVIQKKHGAESTIARLEELFGGCEILYRKKGMYVLEARK